MDVGVWVRTPGVSGNFHEISEKFPVDFRGSENGKIRVTWRRTQRPLENLS